MQTNRSFCLSVQYLKSNQIANALLSSNMAGIEFCIYAGMAASTGDSAFLRCKAPTYASLSLERATGKGREWRSGCLRETLRDTARAYGRIDCPLQGVLLLHIAAVRANTAYKFRGTNRD